MPDVKVEISAATQAAEAAMQRFGSGMESVFRRILAAASVTALAAFSKKLIDTADDLYKMSQRLGITVESLSAFKGIAELAGVEVGELELTLKTAAQQLVNASQGGKEATAVFDRLSISARNTDGSIKNLETLLGDVAERFSEMPDGVNKTDLAVQLFGRSGLKLIPLLNDGRGRIRELMEEMRRLGIVISTETAKAAEDFNDNLTTLMQSLRGFGNKVLTEILPRLVAYTGGMADAAKNNKDADASAKKVASAIEHFFGVIVVGLAGLQFMVSLIYTLYKSFDILSTNIGKAREKLVSFLNVGKSGMGQKLERTWEIVSKLLHGEFVDAGTDIFKEAAKSVGLLIGKAGEIVTDPEHGVQKTADEITALVEKFNKDIADIQEKATARLNALYGGTGDARPKDDRTGGAGAPRRMTQAEFDAMPTPEWDFVVEEMERAAAQSAEAQKKSLRELEMEFMESQRRIREVLARDDLTREEKRRLVGAQMRDEIELVELLKGAYRLLAEDRNESTEVHLMAMERLQKLNEEQLQLATDLRELYGRGFIGELNRGLAELDKAWEDIGANLANTAIKGIEDAVKGVGDAIMGAIDGTKTWGQVFAQISKQIIANLIQVVLQWIAKMTIIRALQAIFNTQQKTEATTRAAAEAPGAALASTASYGAAAIIGAAALGAILALALSQAFATGGLVRGQGGPTSDNVIARVSPGEYVLRAAAVDHYGLGMVDAMNNLALTKPAGGMSAGAAVNSAPAQVHIVQVYNEQDLLRVLQSKMGEQIVVTHIKNNKNEVGIHS